MFSSTSSVQDAPALVPEGTLSKAVLIVREVKTSQKSGATYLDVELRLFGGEYEGRRVYDLIMNPFCPNASEGGKGMGKLAISRICEAIGIFKIGDDASYQRYSGGTIDDVIRDIESQTIAVKIKVEKGQDGRADRNKVAEWLTPNPVAKSAFTAWNDLIAGKTSTAVKAPPSAFSAAPAPVAAPAVFAAAAASNAGDPTWLNKPN